MYLDITDIENNGLYQIYKRYRYLEYLVRNIPKELLKYKPHIYYDYWYFQNLVYDCDLIRAIFINCKRLFDSHRKKTQRLRKRITNLLTKDCVFITFTFTDDVLSNTSSKTRRTYISRELRSLDVPYIANIDFGSQYDREHYHGIAQTDWIDREIYELGGIHVQRVNTNNPLALAKYINKLTNHALKDSTGCARLLYSRQKKEIL